MSSYIDQLRQSMEEEKRLYELAQAQQTAALNQQKDPIKEAAAKLRGDTYTNARLSAIGNNEVLAQKGLAGGVYQELRSGYSETSRIRQDTALRGSLNAADLEEAKKIAEIEAKIKDLGYDTGKQIAASTSRWNEKIAAAVQEEELRRLQREREDQLRRQQQEREDQLRREQQEREDRIRKEEQAFQRELANAAAASARSSAPSYAQAGGGSTARKAGLTAADKKLYSRSLIDRVDSYAQSLGVGRAGTYSQIEQIQRQAWAKALEDLRAQFGGSDFAAIAGLAGAPSDLY